MSAWLSTKKQLPDEGVLVDIKTCKGSIAKAFLFDGDWIQIPQTGNTSVKLANVDRWRSRG